VPSFSGLNSLLGLLAPADPQDECNIILWNAGTTCTTMTMTTTTIKTTAKTTENQQQQNMV
jgi:hypothetical protein